MLTPTNFFLFFLIISIPNVYGTLSANVLPEGDTLIISEPIVLDNNSNLDLTDDVNTVSETTETVGGVEVDLTKEVKFNSNFAGDDVVLANSQLTSVVVLIPDKTIVSGPAEWDNKIIPQKTVTTSGSVPSNFQTPTTSILVGSPDVILVFDKAVLIELSGTTGQTAYKTPGSDDWILISTCTGTYDSPNDPPANGECSVTDGTNTKILTFHFTQFAGLSATPTSTSTPSTGNSGGGGEIGVGSPRIFGSSGGSSGGGTYYGPGDSTPRVFPVWFDNVKDWYRLGDISATEFLNAYQWIIENVMR